jgi:hypothetical protein
LKTERPIAVDSEQSPYRVLAWWDIDMVIGQYRKRKLTARPLRNLERAIGHRLHVSAYPFRFPLPEGMWKFEGFNYVDVADSAFVAHFTLRQISGLSEWFCTLGYREVKSTSADDDFDKNTICTFYWSDRDRPQTYRHIVSGGVLLAMCDRRTAATKSRSSHHVRNERSARPVVRPKVEIGPRSTFLVRMTIHFTAKNRQKLIQLHLPQLIKKYAFRPEDHVDLGPHPTEGEPNRIAVVATLPDIFEHEAVAYCLARTERCRFKLGGPNGEVFVAERIPGHPPFDGVFSISLTREA